MAEKKDNKRSKAKHPNLIKRYNSRIRQEYIDMDYLDQLSEEELEWMNDFMGEYNNAAVSGVKDKTNETAEKENKFHQTAATAKTCTDRNNARNRCEYSIAKAQNMVHRQDYETLQNWLEEKQEIGHNYTEDALIAVLDETEQFGKSAKETNDDTDNS